MRLLFIGDVVGEGGCDFLLAKLSRFKRERGIDVCIANGENSAKGNGATEKSCDMLFKAGVDFITLGNHTFKQRGFEDYLDSAPDVIRPLNYPHGVPGSGVGYIDKGSYTVAVINLCGTVYSEPLSNPFEAVLGALEGIKGAKTVIVDMHAEATSEKRAMGFFLDGRVTAVVGTHTHVQTADECLLPGGTAYITDVGMTGPVNSVLGIEPSLVIRKFRTNMPVRFENAGGAYAMCGCILDIDEKTGRALSVERVRLV